MGIASLMTASIMERSKEIGLMKALGAYQWQIALLFYWEAVLSALIGGVIGCIAGWGLAKFIGIALFNTPLDFTWIVVPCVLLLSIVIAIIGTWLPTIASLNYILLRFYMVANKIKYNMFLRLVFNSLRLRLQPVLIIFSH